MSEFSQGDKYSPAAMNAKCIYVGSGAPGTTYDGMVWVDVSTDPPVVKVYDDTNAQWMTYHPTYYETQSGAWATPAVTPVSNGTICIVYNSTQTDTRVYVYANDAWDYVDTAEAVAAPTFTLVTTDLTSSTVLTPAGIWTTDPDDRWDYQVQHPTEGWLGAGTYRTDDRNNICISDGTNVRLYEAVDGNTIRWTSYITVPTGVSYASGSLVATGTHTLPAGLIFLAASDSDVQVQCNDGGGWVLFGNCSTCIILTSDGTNFRLFNNDAATQYYAYVIAYG